MRSDNSIPNVLDEQPPVPPPKMLAFKPTRLLDVLRGRGQNALTSANAEEALRSMAQMDPDALFNTLDTSSNGLTELEASRRLQAGGANIVSFKKPPSWWLLILKIIPNPFNLLLGVIAIISVASPQPSWETFGVLIFMIFISCAVRFWQEYRSVISVANLQNSVSSNVTVRRQSEIGRSNDVEIPERKVVVGDVLLLTPGDVVAADCLILEANYLRVGQSNLTGESMPVTKCPFGQVDEKGFNTLFDLTNIAFKDTSVVSGSGVALVLKTGDSSYIASIIKQLAAKRETNAFQKGIRKVTYLLIGFMITMVPIVSAQYTAHV